MSKILRLTTENVQRVSVVEITPDGNLVIISGKNGQGKTSVINSIAMLLGGLDQVPPMPVRRGQEKASVEAEISDVFDLGDIIAKRTFTADGKTALIVSNKTGARYPSPQALLDRLVGTLSFDPLMFAQMAKAEQAETLRKLVGLDLTKQKTDKKLLYDERTLINRDEKALAVRVGSSPRFAEIKEERSTADILEQQRKSSEANAKNQAQRNALNLKKQHVGTLLDISDAAAEIATRTEKEIKRLQAALAEQKTKQNTATKAWSDATKDYELAATAVQALADEDLTRYASQIKDVEAHNDKFRQNLQCKTLEDQHAAKKKQASELTTRIDAIDLEMQKAIAAAKFPVPGLALNGEGEVTFGEIPFEQASTAEQLRVSVAIGLAMNPSLRVLLIRRGSDLDEDSLTLVRNMAVEADAQVWLERVSTEGQVSVIIEDGHVKA